MSQKSIEPKKPLKFTIAEQHVKTAKRGKPCECVLAKALGAKYQDNLYEVQVLATVTCLLWRGGLEQRYQTPPVLRAALRHYDETGEWNLPSGEYYLMPIPPSQTKKAVAQRAKERRKNGDVHMTTSYERTGRIRRRKLNPRILDRKTLREAAGFANV